MRQAVFQPQIFEDKEAFNAAHFNSLIVDRIGLPQTLALCVSKAWRIARERTQGKSLRLCSTYMHEQFFEEVKTELSLTSMRHPEINISSCDILSGNERLYIKIEGYTFIFRKEGTTNNQTQQNETILYQETDSHIISVFYETDSFREEVIRVSIKYIVGEKVVYQLDIPVSDASVVVPQYDSAPEPAITPILKRRKGIAEDIV